MRLRPSREHTDSGMAVATLMCCLGLERDFPVRTAGKEVAASSVTPAFGKPAETKKALYVVALSRSAPGKLWEALESSAVPADQPLGVVGVRKSTRLNSSH